MSTPQRLPIVNSDDGVWGDIIRQYLMKEHYNDDTDNAINGGHQKITVRAGTATAGTAPIKLTSGTLLTTAEAGAIEFNTDALYFTQTTSTIRKKVALYDDASGATGDIYYRNSSGYFTRLGIGGNGTFLSVSSGIPSWTSTVTGVTLDNTSTVTLKDANLTLQDDSDTTKQLQFQLSGITTATTRTLTIPDASTTLVGTDATQTLTNKTLTSPTIATPTLSATTIATDTTTGLTIGTSTTQKLGFFNTTPVVQQTATTDLGTALSNLGLRAAGTAYPITTSGNVAFTGSMRKSVTARTGAVTLTTSNAEYQTADATSAAFTITLPSTTTAGYMFTIKKIDSSANAVTVAGTIDGAVNYVLSNQYDTVTVVSTTTSGTWYTIKPALPSSVATLTGSQTLTNKTLDNTNTVTFRDDRFTLQDSVDTTKQAVFELSGITTATTRTLTVPNASTTLVGIDTTDTLTNKTLTSPTITTPVLNGIPTGTGVASAATVSTLALRDSNGNTAMVNLLEGYTTTATSAGTTTLTVSSNQQQFFTGSTTHTLVLPVTSTLSLGFDYVVTNNSTGAVTVQSSGANTILVMAAGTTATFTCILTSGTTASSWSYAYIGDVVASGKKLTVSNSLTLAGTDGTTMTFPGSSDTVVTLGATQTLTGKTISGSGNTLSNIALGSLTTTGTASSSTYLRGDGQWTSITAGDASTNTSSSVDSEVALFSGTAGKTLKRASGTGVAVLASGVLSTVTAPSGTIVGTSDTQTLTSKTLTNPTVNNYTEGVVSIGTVTTSSTLDLTNGTIQTATLTASTACTFTMPTATAGKSFVLLLKQAASTGNGSATFTGVKWNNAGAPTITATAGKMDILSFFADGASWYGSYTQGYTP